MKTDFIEDFDTLLFASLGINDKLNITDDCVVFEGSMSDAEHFREVVNNLWHKRSGWVKKIGAAPEPQEEKL